MELKDRFGGQVEPREWFLVPLTVIEEAVQKLIDGSITHFRYDEKSACVVPRVAIKRPGLQDVV